MTAGNTVSHEAPEFFGILVQLIGVEYNTEAGPGNILLRSIVGQIEGDFLDGMCDICIVTKVPDTSPHTIFRGEDNTAYVLGGSNSQKNGFVQLLDTCVLVEPGAKYQMVCMFSECKSLMQRY